MWHAFFFITLQVYSFQKSRSSLSVDVTNCMISMLLSSTFTSWSTVRHWDLVTLPLIYDRALLYGFTLIEKCRVCQMKNSMLTATVRPYQWVLHSSLTSEVLTKLKKVRLKFTLNCSKCVLFHLSTILISERFFQQESSCFRNTLASIQLRLTRNYVEKLKRLLRLFYLPQIESNSLCTCLQQKTALPWELRSYKQITSD